MIISTNKAVGAHGAAHQESNSPQDHQPAEVVLEENEDPSPPKDNSELTNLTYESYSKNLNENSDLSQHHQGKSPKKAFF